MPSTTPDVDVATSPSGPPGGTAQPGLMGTWLLVMPAAALFLTPFGLLAAEAALEPHTLAILSEKPLVAAQLAIGLVVSVLFCTLPFRLRTRRPGGSPAP